MEDCWAQSSLHLRLWLRLGTCWMHNSIASDSLVLLILRIFVTLEVLWFQGLALGKTFEFYACIYSRLFLFSFLWRVFCFQLRLRFSVFGYFVTKHLEQVQILINLKITTDYMENRNYCRSHSMYTIGFPKERLFFRNVSFLNLVEVFPYD